MILLYNPQSSSTRKPALPQSLLALGTTLEGHYEYQIVDGNLEMDPLGRLDALIRETDPLALGFTVMPGPQLKQAVPLARELKRRHPQLPIVWGGYFPSQHWDVCLRSEYVDYVVRSHGEYILRDLLDALATSDAEAHLPEIAGLAYRDRHGEPMTKNVIARSAATKPSQGIRLAQRDGFAPRVARHDRRALFEHPFRPDFAERCAASARGTF